VLAAAGLRPRVVRDEDLHATVVVGSRVTADFTNPARNM
jgi:hypothetical protein